MVGHLINEDDERVLAYDRTFAQMTDVDKIEEIDEDGLDRIQALVCDAAAAEQPRMVHEGGEYYAERIIRRAIEQGTLCLPAAYEVMASRQDVGASAEADRATRASHVIAGLKSRQSPEAVTDELIEALRCFVGSAVPVASEINPRGHNWCEPYLDEAREIALAALLKVSPR